MLPVLKMIGAPDTAARRTVARALLGVGLLAVAGCATARLPYTPEQQPAGARLSAAYQVLGDRVRIQVDTGGPPLEEVEIVRADGSALRPIALETVPVGSGSPPVGVGVGVGGGHWGGGVGAALLRTSTARCEAAGHDRMLLWVLKENARARRFYEQNGFTADGAEEPFEVEGVGIPEVRYARPRQGAR